MSKSSGIDLKSSSKTSNTIEIKFRKANFLDIPLIFNLILEGCINGAFTDSYLCAAGHFTLFAWVAKSVFPSPSWLNKNSCRTQLRVMHKGAQDVGFVQLQHDTAPDGTAKFKLALIAVAKDHQNQQFGTWALKTIIREMPASALLEVYCTKYSRVMHRLLRKQRFSRDEAIVNNLSRFTLRKPA